MTKHTFQQHFPNLKSIRKFIERMYAEGCTRIGNWDFLIKSAMMTKLCQEIEKNPVIAAECVNFIIIIIIILLKVPSLKIVANYTDASVIYELTLV